MLNVVIPQEKSDIEHYLRQRYRVDNLKVCRGIPAISKQVLRIEQEIRELEEKFHVPQQRLDQLYSNWRPVEAGRNALNDAIHDRCGFCEHYYANIPKQARLVKRATQMCSEYDGISKEAILLLRAKAKPCPQGLWDVFVANQKKDEYGLVVGTRFIGPELCPDFREAKK